MYLFCSGSDLFYYGSLANVVRFTLCWLLGKIRKTFELVFGSYHALTEHMVSSCIFVDIYGGFQVGQHYED